MIQTSSTILSYWMTSIVERLSFNMSKQASWLEQSTESDWSFLTIYQQRHEKELDRHGRLHFPHFHGPWPQLAITPWHTRHYLARTKQRNACYYNSFIGGIQKHMFSEQDTWLHL